MKGVIADVPEPFLAARHLNGTDRWDEMWEGVLHMPPMPGPLHQDLASGIEGWLRKHWLPTTTGRVYREVNVARSGGWPHDYRIPDLVLLDASRSGQVREAHIEGAPLVVIEIRSPGDETDEKLDFYAQIGVPEVWIVDRDSRKPEVWRLRGKNYRAIEVDAAGWLVSQATNVALRVRRPRKLWLQLKDVEPTAESFPQN